MFLYLVYRTNVGGAILLLASIVRLGTEDGRVPSLENLNYMLRSPQNVSYGHRLFTVEQNLLTHTYGYVLCLRKGIFGPNKSKCAFRGETALKKSKFESPTEWLKFSQRTCIS